MSLGQLTDQGLGTEKKLNKYGLDVTNANPLFAGDQAQRYANDYYNLAIQPGIDQAASQQWLNGNLGADASGNSTFGGAYLGNLAAAGRNQSFFAGQDYQNQLASQLLARRQSFFGNDIATAANQNALDVNQNLGLQGIDTQRLAMLNNFNLGSAGVLNNYANTLYGNQVQAQAARTGNIANLLSGGMGLAGGLGGAILGGPAGAKIGSSLGSFFNRGPAPLMSMHGVNY